MKFVGWEENQRRSGGGGGGNGGTGSGMFLKLEVGKKYNVRLVSKPYEYYQHWDPFACRSPGRDPATKQMLDPLLIANPDLKPKKRYAIWVLDLNDNNNLKIMDFASTIYDEFVKWKMTFNDDPGGIKGPNWIIEGKCPTGKKRDTRWSAAYLDRAPFTPEQVTAIEAGNLEARLIDARKPHTPDQIRELMAKFGSTPKEAPQGQAPQQRQAAAQPAAQSAAQQPAAQAQPRRQAAPPPPVDDSGDNIEF